MRIVLAFLSSLVVISSAQAGAYKINVVRDGVTHEQTVYNFWSGEYPMPVIDVNSKIEGQTTINALTELRGGGTAVKCTIQNGLYHPWSSTKNSTRLFYSLTGVQDYVVTKEEILEIGAADKLALKVGDKITEVQYGAEGYCLANHRRGDTLTEIGAFCDAMNEEVSYLKLEKKTASLGEQWLYLNCAEGMQAFVQDKDLLSQPGIKEGQIKVYGEVEAKD